MAGDPRSSGNGEKLVRLSGDDALVAAKLLAQLIDVEPTESGTDPGRALTNAQGRLRLVRKASSIFHERQRRSKYFNPIIFGEPAWDALLALYISDAAGRRLSVGRLITWIGVASTTALRWIDYLEERKYIARRPHPNDKRVVLVELIDKGREAVAAYLKDILTSD